MWYLLEEYLHFQRNLKKSKLKPRKDINVSLNKGLSEGKGVLGGMLPRAAQMLQLSAMLASLGAQTVKNLTAVQETRVRSLGWEDTLEKGMATHSSIFAWKIPWTWTKEPAGYSPRGHKESDTAGRRTQVPHSSSSNKANLIEPSLLFLLQEFPSPPFR